MQETQELAAALEAVRRAARLTQQVQRALVTADTLIKRDRSPVTVADFGAQAIVSLHLDTVLPDLPIIGEESSELLRSEEGRELRRQVIAQVSAQVELGASAEEHILDAIDRCSDGGGSDGRCWVLDPVDGTKGFVRGEQYAIALGLLEDGEVTLGVLGCPNLPLRLDRPGGPRGCLFFAQRGAGAFQLSLDGELDLASARQIQTTDLTEAAGAAFVESVESAHSDHSESARIAAHLGVSAPPVRMDSQCKYAAVARGDASIYLRLPTSSSYREKVWDHAAGSILIEEAGGRVSDIHGRQLDFSLGRTLDHNRGVVASNGPLQRALLEAVSSVLESH